MTMADPGRYISVSDAQVLETYNDAQVLKFIYSNAQVLAQHTVTNKTLKFTLMRESLKVT